VIASGLQPGMLVVSAGVHVLSPGQKVAIYQERSALTTSAEARASGKDAAGAQAATLSATK
jgi:membrane fusion protein, multidrug efflux system